MGTEQKNYCILSCDICKTELKNSDGETQRFKLLSDRFDAAVDCDWTLRQGEWVCPACIEQP